MALFDKSKRTGGFMDEIRCDEPSYLIWKWHPAGVQLGTGNRENAIRWGSSLRVKDGEVAVFVYSQYDGTVQEYIEGPCDLILNTENLPILASLVGLAYDGGTPFQAEVYFINLARIIQAFHFLIYTILALRILAYPLRLEVQSVLALRTTESLSSYIV